MVYFTFNAQYLPIIGKDSALYYAFATTILGVFIAFVLSMFFLYPIYAIHLIFYDKPRPEKWASMAFGVIAVLPTFGLFVLILLYLFDIQLNYSLFALVLCLVPCVWLMYCFGLKNIALLVILYFMLILDYLMIVSWIIAFDPTMEPKDFIGISVLIALLFAFCVGALVFTHFNLVKTLFVVGILCIVAIPFLLSSFIVSKFHIGNYTAKKLVFTQEAIESVAVCQPTQGANNTLILSNIKVISSLGEYILLECSGIKEPQKVPMRFLVGETLHSSVDFSKNINN